MSMLAKKSLSKFCDYFTKKTVEFETFSELLKKIQDEKYLRDKSLEDIQLRCTLLCAVVNPHYKKDPLLMEYPYYDLINKDYDLKEYAESIAIILIADSYFIPKRKELYSIKFTSSLIHGLYTIAESEVSSQLQQDCYKRIFALLDNMAYFHKRLKMVNEVCLVHNLNFLMNLSLILKKPHILIVLLNFVIIKERFYKLGAWESLSGVLNSIQIKDIFAMELANLNHFLATWYSTFFETKILNEILMDSLNCAPEKTFHRLALFLLVVKKFRIQCTVLINKVCLECITCLSNLQDKKMQFKIFTKFVFLAVEFDFDLKSCFFKFRDSEFLKNPTFHNKYIAFGAMNYFMKAEIKHMYQQLPSHKSLTCDKMWEYPDFDIKGLDQIVPMLVFLNLLQTVKRSPWEEKGFNIYYSWFCFTYYLREIKGLNLNEYSFLKESTQIRENNSTNKIKTSSLVLYFNSLLKLRKGIKVTREAYCEFTQVDFLIEFDDEPGRKVVVELDGGFHYVRKNCFTSKTMMRNFFLILMGWKVVVLRNDFLEAIIANQEEHQIIDYILDKNNGARLSVLQDI